MNLKEILSELRRLVDHLEIELAPLLPDSGFKSTYAPIKTYLEQLQKGTKPETAAEGLFRALAEIFFDARALPQVGLASFLWISNWTPRKNLQSSSSANRCFILPARND